MRRWAILNVVLLVLVVLLAIEIVLTWARTVPLVEPVVREAAVPGETPAAAPRDKRRGGERASSRAGQAPEMLVATIAEKELFDASRKPSSEAAQGGVAGATDVPRQTDPPAGVTITGVRMVGRDSEVFIEDASAGQKTHRRLRQGDEVAGYTVKAIKPAAVTFASPSGDLVTMALTIEKGKGGGAAAPNRVNQPPASPAAGVSAPSPAAGIGGRPAVTATPPRGVPTSTTIPPRQSRRQRAVQQQQPQLPAEVQRKLEQLRSEGARGEKKQ